MDILKLSQYQERSYAESANSKGFVNYGDDNLFPQYLIDLFHSSSTHNALTTTIATMVFGEGFDATTLEVVWHLTNGISTMSFARLALTFKFKAALLWR